MVLRQLRVFLVAIDPHGCCVFFVVDVREALEEDKREDELLVVACVDEASKEHCSTPEVGLQFFLGDAAGHAVTSFMAKPHLANSVSRATRVSAAASCPASRTASAC